MTAGSVSIAADGTETKSGFAEVVYDAAWTELLSDYATFGVTPPSDLVTIVATKKALAKTANRFALVITYIQANAETSVEAETIL